MTMVLYSKYIKQKRKNLIQNFIENSNEIKRNEVWFNNNFYDLMFSSPEEALSVENEEEVKVISLDTFLIKQNFINSNHLNIMVMEIENNFTHYNIEVGLTNSVLKMIDELKGKKIDFRFYLAENWFPHGFAKGQFKLDDKVYYFNSFMCWLKSKKSIKTLIVFSENIEMNIINVDKVIESIDISHLKKTSNLILENMEKQNLELIKTYDPYKSSNNDIPTYNDIKKIIENQ